MLVKSLQAILDRVDMTFGAEGAGQGFERGVAAA
jgi:hypothetical protein